MTQIRLAVIVGTFFNQTTNLLETMTHYEMLTVFPGTLTETEVAPIVTIIKDTLSEHGGSEIEIHDMGKSRLAYPMQHIRYGYFYLLHFSAEPAHVRELTSRVRLVNNILRLVVRSFDPNKPMLDTVKLKLTPLASVVGGAETESADTRAPRNEFRPRETAVVEKAPEIKITTPSDGKITLDDIEEKLDQILEQDLEKV